ncbi:rod shape-determining protein MreD [Plasticicumulans sp.]|uniref:rod shape-determining protein MreD n=1 Tax=Plasticicumulans sp. TaxID=2307179 RepID=UPI002C361DA3|nr:rod shape-determining protein MreD [Plasticicumulans sp.]MBS0600154.1 rod shape-determining protein MreD [Pseudomonadota bacterium]HMV38835.1 rod shape-determining protein MreD [Plasticicumulans sp.]HMW29844.1 rod shape-determining protein MreD [Plasticicumulans sp.]HMW41094.1 rod shape-determining protein MreD [Plasticicumulans sp.]HMX52900.1 rod shape-determining protein MreD [Plasticicumulans sp.]
MGSIETSRGYGLVLLTFVVALMLSSLHLPPVIDRFRPDWVGLVLTYWALALPNRVGVGTGWVLGLIQDTAQGTLLGQHALGLATVAWLTVRFHQRIRVFPLWQQALSVASFLMIEQLLVVWIKGITGYPPGDWWYLAPPLGGMLAWPWVFIVLRDLRRRFQVS